MVTLAVVLLVIGALMVASAMIARRSAAEPAGAAGSPRVSSAEVVATTFVIDHLR